MRLLILLPLLALAAGFVLLWAGSANGPTSGLGDWKDAYLRATVLWGGVLLLTSETLGLFQRLDRFGLAICWAGTLLILAWIGWRRRAFRAVVAHLAGTRVRISSSDAVLIGGMAAVVGLLLIVVWLSPPNNIDSLLYHMSRVVHWAQNRSLGHYPAGMEHQLTKPIWAETAILNLRALWGDDRPAGLVQWFSMVGSLVGVSAIVGVLGGNRMARWLAAILVLSIPMGILQATSTQNDFVAAFWMVTLAYFVAHSRSDQRGTTDAVFVGISAGLGILTKGTAFVYSIPFLVWFVFPLRGRGARRWILEGSLVAILVALLNLGFWTRNLVTFGGPYGTSGWLTANVPLSGMLGRTEDTGVDLAPAATAPVGQSESSPIGETGPPTPTPGLSSTATGTMPSAGSRLLSFGLDMARGLPHKITLMAAYNLVTPLRVPNAYLFRAMELAPGILGPDEVLVIRRLVWNHEDTAGNPLHLLAISLALVGGWLLRPARRWVLFRIYMLAVAATYLLIPVVIGHGATIWGIRYQLPFFVLGSVVPAVVLGEILPTRAAKGMGMILILLAFPWVLLNRTRPLVGSVPRNTNMESILSADRTEIMLSNYTPEAQNDYARAAEQVRSLGCATVGLRLTQQFSEYPFWWILDAPQSGIRIESLYHSSATEQYVDRSFDPCVVICSDCGDGTEEPTYSLVARYGDLSVFKPEH